MATRKRTKDPNAPKKAKLAWTACKFFREDHIAELKKDFPDLKSTEMTKLVGERWAQCKDRAKYEELAAKAKEVYNSEIQQKIRGATDLDKLKLCMSDERVHVVGKVLSNQFTDNRKKRKKDYLKVELQDQHNNIAVLKAWDQAARLLCKQLKEDKWFDIRVAKIYDPEGDDKDMFHMEEWVKFGMKLFMKTKVKCLGSTNPYRSTKNGPPKKKFASGDGPRDGAVASTSAATNGGGLSHDADVEEAGAAATPMDTQTSATAYEMAVDVNDLDNRLRTSGLKDVQVAPCTQEFYEQTKNESYKMTKVVRGLCMIINVQFKEQTERWRRGTDIDAENLKRLFGAFHFKVITYSDEDDLSAEGIRKKVKDFSLNPEHKEADAAVLCILSHGANGQIVGTDDEMVNIANLLGCLDNKNCTALHNKPKIVIIQACRGTKEDRGVISTDGGNLATDFLRLLPLQSDSIVCLSCDAGYTCYRSNTDAEDCGGSFYIDTLVKVLMENAHNKDMLGMLTMVKKIFKNHVIDNQYYLMKQFPADKSDLTEHLYFYPGIKL